MDRPIVQGIITFLGGAAVAALNALLSARMLKKKVSAYASFSAVRQLFNVAYLVLVFFGARALGWDVTAPLLGAALGLTGLSMLFAFWLARYNDKLTKSSAQAEKKGGKENG